MTGMKLTTTIALLVLSSVLVAVPVKAESAFATMTVSTQVIARAVVAVDSAPAAVEVTSDDINRGYVDVVSPITIRVKTNSRRGYMLQVDKVSEVFSRVELSAATLAMTIAQESWIERPYVAGGDIVPVHARLHLAAGATPGWYALPVAFSASPL
jgi:hypothetical protein